MASSLKSPGTIVSDGSSGWTTAWTNPGNAASSNNSYAVAACGTADGTEYLLATNFGFEIPAGATINGVVVEIEADSAAVGMCDTVALLKSSAPASSNYGTGSPPSGDGVYDSFGGVADLWGTTWSVAEINDSGFGVALVYITSEFDAATFSVDHVRITVHYTEAAAGGQAPRSMHQFRQRRAS